jgi:hypothetical protein
LAGNPGVWGTVLHDEDGCAEFPGQKADQRLQRPQTSCGATNYDNIALKHPPFRKALCNIRLFAALP